MDTWPPEPIRRTVTPTRQNQTKTVILKPSQRPNLARRKIEANTATTMASRQES
jgi:hypothetical protein